MTLVTQEGEGDVCAVGTLRLTYWRTYTAEENSLTFTVAAKRRVLVGGFSSPLHPGGRYYEPKAGAGSARVSPESQESGYAVELGLSGSGKRTLLAFTEETIKQPATLTANQTSTWHRRTGQISSSSLTETSWRASAP